VVCMIRLLAGLACLHAACSSQLQAAVNIGAVLVAAELFGIAVGHCRIRQS
jgi:hypothetical protein